MRYTVLLLVLLTGASAVDVKAFGRRVEPLETRITVAAEVDADGRVVDLKFADENLPALIRDPLERDIRNWEFEAAQVDGRAAPSLTHLALIVRAEPLDRAGDAYALRIIGVSNGPGLVETVAPRYPHEGLRNRVDAQMVVAGHLSADGRMRAPEVVFYESNRDRHREAFERAAVEAVSRWTFAPELVDGKPIETRVRVPMSFCVSKPPCPTPKLDDAPEGDTRRFAALAATKLKTDAVGRVL